MREILRIFTVSITYGKYFNKKYTEHDDTGETLASTKTFIPLYDQKYHF